MTINIAQVGLGYWGPNLARNLMRLSHVRLHTLCEPRRGVLEKFGAEHPEVRLTDTYQTLLDDEEVQAVVIATPAETHYELTRRALKANKDVLVEKPLSLTHGEGGELVRLADERRRVLMVGHVLEYHPAIVRLHDLVRKGHLGKVRYIYSNRLSLGRVRREENILWSFAPHDIAIILRLMGQLPFQVVACGGSYLQPNLADVTVTNLLFDNGVRAHIHVSWLHPFKEQRLVVIGSEKMASFDDVTKRLVLYDQRVELHEGEPVPMRSEGTALTFSDEEPLYLECRAFVNAVQTREPPLTDGRSGLRVLKVLQAAQRSLITNGQSVALPLAEDDESTFLETAVAAVR